jgi:hypothetical protein
MRVNSVGCFAGLLTVQRVGRLHLDYERHHCLESNSEDLSERCFPIRFCCESLLPRRPLASLVVGGTHMCVVLQCAGACVGLPLRPSPFLGLVWLWQGPLRIVNR